MKNIKYFFYIIFIIILLGFFYFLFNLAKTASPEIAIHSNSFLGEQYGKVVAASCGFYTAGHKFEDYNDCTLTCGDGSNVVGINRCGGTCVQKNATRNPLATCSTWTRCGGPEVGCEDYTSCTYSCPSGYTGVAAQVNANVANSCVLNSDAFCPAGDFCTAGKTPVVTYTGYNKIKNGFYYFTNNSAVTPSYTLPSCAGGVPSGYKRVCEVSRSSSDGTQTGSWTEDYDTNHTIWTGQPSKAYPYNENLTVQCGYYKISTNSLAGSKSSIVVADAKVLHPNYGLPCTTVDHCGVTLNGITDEDGVCVASTTNYATCSVNNVCGENFSGYACPSGCYVNSGADINNSCLNSFQFTTDTINPNGSVEFSWNIQSTTSVANCSFVDLTTPTPRPIPGLQNLSASTDRIRITNIQKSTRFCLVCKFYDILNPTVLLGEAVKHQWVRVQRIGEN